ncbi:hypothetical protein OVX45_27650, partial [Klebsiella pneumoniae]|uniref:hypothetical protein n=1 Tax=Klebsiella pneumoniae TaxID=573 RepID=UPI0022722194
MSDAHSMTLAPGGTDTRPQPAIIGLLGRIPYDLIALVARISMAAVFWQSGQTKIKGWHVSENAIYLFQN